MKKIFIKFFLIIIFIPIIIALVGMYKFNILQDDIYIEGLAPSEREQNLYFLESWIEPVLGNKNEVLGFTLKGDGSASSINMATFPYQNWKIKNDKNIVKERPWAKKIDELLKFEQSNVFIIKDTNYDNIYIVVAIVKKDNKYNKLFFVITGSKDSLYGLKMALDEHTHASTLFPLCSKTKISDVVNDQEAKLIKEYFNFDVKKNSVKLYNRVICYE